VSISTKVHLVESVQGEENSTGTPHSDFSGTVSSFVNLSHPQGREKSNNREVHRENTLGLAEGEVPRMQMVQAVFLKARGTRHIKAHVCPSIESRVHTLFLYYFSHFIMLFI
jgi:hypothetical protein